MSTAAVRRLTKELKTLMEDPPVNIGVRIIDENIYLWEAVIVGPRDTPFEGGKFYLNMMFPDDYPFKPPKVKFTTRVYHPNISEKGEICISILRDRWSAALTARTILLSILSMFDDPNPDDPLDHDIATQYKNDKEEYEKTAREYTERYASETR